MGRIASLNILLDPSGKDFLAELYGKVIENVQKSTISNLLKNRDLSGDPESGSVEAKRFANATSSVYGTARGNGKGEAVKAKPVTVQINIDREIVEELETKDTLLYGVDGLLERRSTNHVKSMVRELERAFFTEAREEGIAFTPPALPQNEVVESLIQSVEITKNDYVDGVDRDMMSLIMQPSEYGKMRNFLDTDVNNANVNTAANEFVTFHGVRAFSSVYLPPTAKMIIMVDGSVALPVLPRQYTAEKIPLSEAYAVELFYYYGVKAVTPDLIRYIAA